MSADLDGCLRNALKLPKQSRKDSLGSVMDNVLHCRAPTAGEAPTVERKERKGRRNTLYTADVSVCTGPRKGETCPGVSGGARTVRPRREESSPRYFRSGSERGNHANLRHFLKLDEMQIDLATNKNDVNSQVQTTANAPNIKRSSADPNDASSYSQRSIFDRHYSQHGGHPDKGDLAANVSQDKSDNKV